MTMKLFGLRALNHLWASAIIQRLFSFCLSITPLLSLFLTTLVFFLYNLPVISELDYMYDFWALRNSRIPNWPCILVLNNLGKYSDQYIDDLKFPPIIRTKDVNSPNIFSRLWSIGASFLPIPFSNPLLGTYLTKDYWVLICFSINRVCLQRLIVH